MLNKQNILDFFAVNELANSEFSQLFSLSEQINESEYLMLTEKLCNGNNFSFYWSNPSEYFSFLAYGEVYSICKNEFADLSKFDEQLTTLPFRINSNYGDNIGTTNPLFVGGIKFPSAKNDEIWRDFEFAKWSIPQILLIKNENEFKIIINTFKQNIDQVFSLIDRLYSSVLEIDNRQIKILSVEPNVGMKEWLDCVESALEKISKKELQKVVLSRFIKIELSDSPNIFQQLQRLEIRFDNCITFAYKSKKSIFFGATPEKLFSVKNGLLETDALAGSIQRGLDDIEDKAFAKILLEDEKNLTEHKSVVDFILDQLTPVTEKILFDSQPSIKKYSNIQHLYSQIRAVLKDDVSFFSLLEKLYPTPAVCGFPSDKALETINELESFDRGLFAGTVGWFNLKGHAYFSVGIRSALLHKGIIHAYAGCGILNGSDPLSEFNETELKLKPILNLFAHETVCKS